jgi:dipeptidyl-peptidase 4
MRRHLLLLAFATPLTAQQRQLTVDDYARAERFLASGTSSLVTGMGVRPTWLPDGRFWYRAVRPAGTAFFVVDPAQKTSKAFDTTGTGQRRVAGAPRNSSVSPDGARAAFIRNHNLWVKDLRSGSETQLTTDGIADFGYATNNAGWVHSDDPVLTWSPDSKKIATFQHDGRGVSDMYLVRTKVGEPELEAWKYPLPGDSVIFRISRVVIDLDAAGGPKVIRFNMPPDAHRSTVSDHVACSGGTICDVQWYPDGSNVAFVSSSRDHKHAWFRVANTSTGEVRTLFEETMPTQVGDASFTENLWRILPASNELIWWSQRDNWTQLYLYDLTTGKLKNRITSGDGNVNDILHIDAKSRTIFFEGQGKEPGRDPYFRHFYRVGFDGKNQRLLSAENADHTISVAPDGKSFVDSYSTPSIPPVTVLRDMNGATRMTLERADIARLAATGWKPPTQITMKARDGKTDIYGLMWTPARLDSTKKYPIIDYIYPGPQSGSVGSRSFQSAVRDNQALAELGFVVVAIDGMGTPGRSKAFADAYYGDMGDNTLPDQVAGIKELAQKYRFIDIDKVGIWGHSGGGFATAAAMFRYPDFFKVGISESGNHDQRNYEDDWGERYQGLLSRGPSGDNYADEANQTHARNLKGKLMLAHGAMDNNVPPYNTWLVVDQLQRANKDYDLVIFPQARHGFGDMSAYMMRRRWDYFVKNLMGAEPPKEYQMGVARQPAMVP